MLVRGSCLAFAITLFGAAPAHANSGCFITLVNVNPHARLAEPLPPAIPETKRASEYPNAVDAYGTMVKDGETLPAEQLKDGIYLYVIAHAQGKRYVLWGLRAPGEIEPGKNLVTHNALVEKLSRTLGLTPKEITVRGAGQSQILNGQVSTLDNQSGSRRGGAEHLAYAEDVLRAAGLPIQSGTARLDLSKEEGDQDVHADADEQAQIVAKVRANPSLLELSRQIARRHRQIYEEFPELRDPETPGYLLKDKVLARTEVDPDRTLLTPTEAGNLSMYRLALRYLQKDGPEFAANNMREMNSAELLKWIDWGIAQHRAQRTVP